MQTEGVWGSRRAPLHPREKEGAGKKGRQALFPQGRMCEGNWGAYNGIYSSPWGRRGSGGVAWRRGRVMRSREEAGVCQRPRRAGSTEEPAQPGRLWD